MEAKPTRSVIFMRWILVLITCLSGCLSRDPRVVIRAIPGTEQTVVNSACISISPQEKWLVFAEWKLPKSRVFEELPAGEYERRLVSLDLETGRRTEHTIDSIPPKALGFSTKDIGWKQQMGFEIIEERFRPPGWGEGLFYCQPYFDGTFVALRPGEPGIRIAPKPETPGTCSDCRPVVTSHFRGHSWDLLSKDVSAIVQDKTIRSIYYQGPRPYKTHMIFHLPANGDEELIAERSLKKRTLLTISSLRVSQDERYLAYVVHSKKQEFFAGPREEIFVMDLVSREEKKIATYSAVGNLIWSEDGERLYFAGESSGDAAVYVVDVAATFVSH